MRKASIAAKVCADCKRDLSALGTSRRDHRGEFVCRRPCSGMPVLARIERGTPIIVMRPGAGAHFAGYEQRLSIGGEPVVRVFTPQGNIAVVPAVHVRIACEGCIDIRVDTGCVPFGCDACTPLGVAVTA